MRATIFFSAFLLLGACGRSGVSDDCKAECLQKSRAALKDCGDNQTCKQGVLADFRNCMTACAKP